ncbi:hypothetical protein MSAN_01726200 [Mycena sanguinolenta]|uniref:DUF7137 domain-containing protein n=1 Tax=Mycena sanguinolenta TaxID=230812 RepID=A0A8H6XZ12_9AGAR|nr:hypothetical protein MSAN_01726200 [Mycena sanguinolenta]
MSSVSSPSGGASGSGSGSGAGNSSAPVNTGSSVAPSSSGPLTFAQTLPPGLRIAEGNLFTIVWNFTSVLATPTSLTMSAVNDHGNTFPVGPDESGRVPGTATSVVWDVWSYNQAHPGTQMGQGSYTLHMWDDRGPSATVQAGYMTPNSALQFAMYTPARLYSDCKWTMRRAVLPCASGKEGGARRSEAGTRGVYSPYSRLGRAAGALPVLAASSSSPPCHSSCVLPFALPLPACMLPFMPLPFDYTSSPPHFLPTSTSFTRSLAPSFLPTLSPTFSLASFDVSSHFARFTLISLRLSLGLGY